MAKYSSKDLAISFNGQVMSQHALEISAIKVGIVLEESHSFGDTWREVLSAGIKSMEPVTISGFYDDTATTGPDAVFGTVGTSGTLLITWGSTKTTSVTALVQDYSRLGKVGGLTRYSVTLQPSGTVTEA